MSISKKQAFKDRLKAEFGNYHPLLAMAHMANDPEIEDPDLKFKCHKAVAEYVEPKLKAVEHSGDLSVEMAPLVINMAEAVTAEEI